MALKLRDDMWGLELGISSLFLLLSMIGMAIALVGVGELPRCRYGGEACYFFVQKCGSDEFNKKQRTCTWVPKARAIEASSEDGMDQLIVPIVGSIIAVLPGLVLVVTTIVRNERILFGLIEAGKLFLAFDTFLLIVGAVSIDRLTFDCRWWNDNYTGNVDACQGGYSKYIIGSCIIFFCEAALLIGLVMFGEMERRRVRGDIVTGDFETGDEAAFQTDAVPMNTRVTVTARAAVGGGGRVGVGSQGMS